MTFNMIQRTRAVFSSAHFAILHLKPFYQQSAKQFHFIGRGTDNSAMCVMMLKVLLHKYYPTPLTNTLGSTVC